MELAALYYGDLNDLVKVTFLQYYGSLQYYSICLDIKYRENNENICTEINLKSRWGRQHFRPSVDSDAVARALSKVGCLKTYRNLMNNERADGDDIDDGGRRGINQNFQAGSPHGVCCAYLCILLHYILLHCIWLHCNSDFPPLHFIMLPSLSEHRTWFEICTSQEVYSHPDAVVLNFCSVFISIAVPCVVLKVYSHCSARAMPSQLPD